MTNCTQEVFPFPSVDRLKVQRQFSGGEVTSDGGVLRLGLTSALARALPDPRSVEKIVHALQHMLRQRIFGIASGYEDLNDHATMRDDTALQMAVGCRRSLASYLRPSSWGAATHA